MPTPEQNHEACLPRSPAPQANSSDHHEGKQAIHDNHTGQAQNEKSHHVDESLDHGDFPHSGVSGHAQIVVKVENVFGRCQQFGYRRKEQVERLVK